MKEGVNRFFGTDEGAINRALTQGNGKRFLPEAQINAIKRAYRDSYGTDMMSDLKSELNEVEMANVNLAIDGPRLPDSPQELAALVIKAAKFDHWSNGPAGLSSRLDRGGAKEMLEKMGPEAYRNLPTGLLEELFEAQDTLGVRPSWQSREQWEEMEVWMDWDR